MCAYKGNGRVQKQSLLELADAQEIRDKGLICLRALCLRKHYLEVALVLVYISLICWVLSQEGSNSLNKVKIL